MSFFESLMLVFGAFALITLLGIGPVLICLPKTVRQYSLFIAPSAGYILFCLFSIWGSGFFNISVLNSNWVAFFALSLWAVYGGFIRRYELLDILRAAKWLPVLLFLILIVIFFPVFIQGINLYLGTVNPDFYQSLAFHESLVRFKVSFWVDKATLPLNSPFLDYFPGAFQARFGAVVFSVFIEQIFAFPPRACLMTSIIVFLCCLPLVVYFFSRLVLEFDQKKSLLSAVLVILVAPTTMSFLHTFIGQNSALAAIPLAISFSYLALRERSIPFMALTTLILCGMFWLYVMSLPYVLVPIGLYIFVSSIRYGWNYIKWLFLSSGCALSILVVIYGPHLTVTIQFINDLRDLLSKVVTESNFYLDFLTEDVLSYANGLTSFPLTQSMLFHSVSHIVAPILFFISVALVCIYFIAVRLWSKRASYDAITIVLCLISTYILVWINYTFLHRYGYASFKMVSWLQFIAVPFYAWSIIFFVEKIRQKQQTILSFTVQFAFLLLLIPGYIGLNIISDIDYALKSFGHDRYLGTLINSYGVSNNQDFPALERVLDKKIPSGSSIATGFGDSIENFWAAYYIDKAGTQARMLSHELLPIDDAYLPDMLSRKYIDFRGTPQIHEQRYFHSGKADYYLLPGNENLNRDIVTNKISSLPLWSNNTFALYRKEDIKDLIVTGPGFFRVEYINRNNIQWWWPEVYRWTAEGGELIHLFPSLPNHPYRVRLTAIAELGLPDGRRTLEFWHNGIKFDEIVVNGVARITSKPYEPVEGVNRLVIRIKEQAKLPQTNNGLWNRDLPRRSRQINLLVSNVNILTPNLVNNSNWKTNTVVEARSMFDLMEEYNGFNVDGWVRDTAKFSIIAPSSGSAVKLKVVVPGNLGFKFPYKAGFLLNGVNHKIIFDNPGEHVVVLDLPKHSKQHLLKLDIEPDEAKQIADGIDQREVLQSIQLRSIEFLKEKEVNK